MLTIGRAAVAAIWIALLLPTVGSATTVALNSRAVLVNRTPPAGIASNEAAAAAYCGSTGGVVQARDAEYGTNDSNPLVLAGVRNFCQYTLKNDGSHINLLLETLYTQKPTLAALAYYAKVKPGSCQGNPASCYCSLLGGTDLFGGINAAGGGWVLQGNPSDVLDTCIFPDESSIDSFGLFYHSASIIRGIDLATVLRYRH